MILDPREARDRDWLALAIRSEDDEPHAWIPLGWVMRNRVESGSYPDSYFEVITQAYQFSYFNQFRGIEDEGDLFDAALAGYAGDAYGWEDNDFAEAQRCATQIMIAPRWTAPFSHRVYYFWAPGGMVVRGTDPPWAENLRRVFTLPGLARWKFGE